MNLFKYFGITLEMYVKFIDFYFEKHQNVAKFSRP